jgi:hypothetical protein
MAGVIWKNCWLSKGRKDSSTKSITITIIHWTRRIIVIVVLIGGEDRIGFFAKFEATTNVHEIRVLLNRERSVVFILGVGGIKVVITGGRFGD